MIVRKGSMSSHRVLLQMRPMYIKPRTTPKVTCRAKDNINVIVIYYATVIPVTGSGEQEYSLLHGLSR